MKHRVEVERFADLMESVLRANDHKSGWDRVPVQELLACVCKEVGELACAIACNKSKYDVRSELADVANFCMFISEVYRLND